MFVSDGTRILANAAGAIRPANRIQRRTFQTARQVKGHMPLNSKIKCGRELVDIANKPKGAPQSHGLPVTTIGARDESDSCKGSILKDNKRPYTHVRLERPGSPSTNSTIADRYSYL